ncbi:MAG: pyridoxal phosphate-dependent aminotransferase [Syntrophobacterales bacterium]|jgi:aspartate aminotransferase|nr:pyridoxal phosphate-dependent aminotransferase [Syntrophobacterales bacterium]
MIISKEIQRLIEDQEGWTRRMFEEGIRIKKLYGEDSVYDFSLGNPDTEPPEVLSKALIDAVTHPTAGMHRYMPNSGYEEVRTDIANYLREERGLPFTSAHVFMTAGCAGGLNMILRSILDQGDEVIIPSPFFWEFKNYIKNAEGISRFVETKEDFQLDIGKIEEAITPKTRAILINSPNNPTGAVYNEESLKELAALLNEKREQGQDIFIVSDDAYRKIVYDGNKLPNLFAIYDLVLAVTSHSKDLALPGERIGYIAISPKIEEFQLFVSALTITIRTLGFVNAPALFQRIVGKFQQYSVSIADYEKKRDVLYNTLVEAGFECVKPTGAFYMFPKSPIPDELEFVRALQQEERIMVVPGRGFGRAGYFRIAYCVPLEKILGSINGFTRIGKRYL